MKRLSLVCIVLLATFLSIGLAAQAQAPAKDQKIDVTGTWDVAFDTPMGPMNPVATYKQDGEKLTGTQQGPMGEEKLEGTVKGNDIRYEIKIDMDGQQMTITYTGKIEGDSISGTLQMGDFGSTTWTAKRKK